jgi:hypothetical protein
MLVAYAYREVANRCYADYVQLCCMSLLHWTWPELKSTGSTCRDVTCGMSTASRTLQLVWIKGRWVGRPGCALDAPSRWRWDGRDIATNGRGACATGGGPEMQQWVLGLGFQHHWVHAMHGC